MAEKKESNLVNIIIGIIMIILNILWIYYQVELLYRYHIRRGFYFEQTSDWILILNIICGLIGILLAIRLIKRKVSAWTAIPVNFGLICICILIESILF